MLIFSSETEPPGAKRRITSIIQTTDEKNLFSRVFLDDERKVYFGYDLIVEPIAENGKFKLTFKSLTISPDKILPFQYDEKSAPSRKLTPLALPKYPEPQTIQDGDTLVVDVLIHQQTGVKVVDLIKVVSNYSVNSASVKGGITGVDAGANNQPLKPPRDFAIENVEMKIVSSKLLVNGKPVTSNAENSRLMVRGAIIWFYLPERGRFIISLIPRKGYNFIKTGTIQGNKIKFSVDGDQYEWISAEPILTTGNEAWTLAVLRDRNYVPEIRPTKEFPYLFGAADDVVYLLKQK